MITEFKEQIVRAPGAYSIPEASLYVSATMPDNAKFPLNTRHLHHWVKDGLAGGYLTGTKNRKLFINFRDLISLRVIAAMRSQGIKHKEILIAEKELKKLFEWEYPFAMSDFWVAKPDIYMKIQGVFISVSRHLQYALDMVTEYIVPVHGLTFDLYGVSATWTPHTDILLNPEIQYGAPCISGTRVPTETIWSFYDAGDTVETISFAYGLQHGQINNAIDWEELLKKSSN
ncbi:DUF433 domain-containing protein [Chloroflexota bacterium]